MTWYKLNEKRPKVGKPIIIRNDNKAVDELAKYNVVFLDKYGEVVNCEFGIVLEKEFHKNFSWSYIND